LIDALLRAVARPTPFQPSDAPFWDDPYIATQLLAAHLDETHDAASRPGSVIEASVAALVERGIITAGTRVLDLGCGPGLVSAALARAGARVTGIDVSAGSIEYAREHSGDLGIDFRVQDFFTIDDVDAYDVVLQSYGELATFSDEMLRSLLARIERALAPGGVLVFDVSTPALRAQSAGKASWESCVGGLWRPVPHLVLTQRHEFDGQITCEQYVVIDDEGPTAYRMWFHDYTPETLRPNLESAGFTVAHMWGSLAAEPYSPQSPWLAVVALASGDV
jgi:SAM-dependent methyltransferase